MPGTRAWRATAGTMTLPDASRPSVAGGPPPDANTRSKSASLRAAGRAEVVDDPGHAAALGHVPHQLGRPGVDLLVALLAEARLVLRRVGRQTGACHGPSCCVVVRPSMPDRPPQAPVPSLVGWADHGGQRGLARTLGPLVEQLGEAPTDRSGRRHGRGIGEQGQQRHAQRLGRGRDRRPVRADPSPMIGSPTRTRTRPPKRSQLVPLMAIGTSGTCERRAKYAGPSLSGSRPVSSGPIRPSPAIATTPAGVDHGRDAPRRLEQVVLAGLVRDGRPGPGHQSIATARRPCPPPSDRRRTGAAGTAGCP